MKKNIVFITVSCFALLLMPMKSKAQQAIGCNDGKPEQQDRDIITNPEQRAEFPEGQKAMLAWIKSNLRWNPITKENNIQGKVILGAVVEKDGSLNEVRIYRGFEILNPDAIRVVCAMPNWKPAKHKGKIVRSLVTIPILYRLEE
jgi:periplasmic protein TonB